MLTPGGLRTTMKNGMEIALWLSGIPELQAQRVHRSPHFHSWVVMGTEVLKLNRAGFLHEVVGWARPDQARSKTSLLPNTI